MRCVNICLNLRSTQYKNQSNQTHISLEKNQIKSSSDRSETSYRSKQNFKNNIVFVIRGEFLVINFVFVYLAKIKHKKQQNPKNVEVKDVTV